ncbi:MAG: hypothetical protein M2R45_00039 [Verrucomicrobia subdivision 3 bacterium]|nr:hypothetical protein [Limisphaerales bacterium]MCS1412502.1 hypothetical protein [Limisphaerales bacterium]
MSQVRQFTLQFRLLVGLSVGLTCPLLNHADEEITKKATSQPHPGIQFGDFALILDNNIFDANRQDRARLDVERQRNQESLLPADRFALVGTMHDDDKAYAFFTGTQREFRSVLKVEQDIAGYTVKSIDDKVIMLAKDGESFEFAIGMEMSRQPKETEWKLDKNASGDWRPSVSGGLSRSSDSQKATEKPAPLSGSASDILRKMMERRRQEINQ